MRVKFQGLALDGGLFGLNAAPVALAFVFAGNVEHQAVPVLHVCGRARTAGAGFVKDGGKPVCQGGCRIGAHLRRGRSGGRGLGAQRLAPGKQDKKA